MKRLLTVLLAVPVLLVWTGTAFATIDWAGEIWPIHGYTVSEGSDVAIYLQIYKTGKTEPAGQGDSILATLYYGPELGPYTSVAMSYLGDVGNNDEYRGFIPAAAIEGQDSIWFYCEAYDSTDASTYTGAKDQNQNDPPFVLNITPVLNQEVTVWFGMCMPPEGDPDYDPDPGDICITGSTPELTNWGSGVLMARPCDWYSPLFYQVSVTFPAGSSPYIEYKFRKWDCVEWEPGGNHSVMIDDTNPTMLMPWIDHFGWYEGDDCPLCGVGTETSTWGKIKGIYK
ncbi:MAG: hypothetical protein JSV33_03790 [bacterium]|nr:MAG: hypothetical protein JSV33_03790 [bacterium]